MERAAASPADAARQEMESNDAWVLLNRGSMDFSMAQVW